MSLLDLDLDMVTVPEGVFLMGWDPQFDAGIKERELPLRKIWLSAFKIQKIYPARVYARFA